ncbi:MAG: TrkA family potassium uptake protein [Clostridia bacterium]|nr:TrkA family potassium uptake protein [Clostridia bacterium]
MAKSVLLIGLGEFGLHMAKKLNEMNIEVMGVDFNEEKVNEALPFVTEAQIGDSTNPEFLETLGVRNYDCCVVTIGANFQNSLETTSLLSEMGAKRVISRANTEIHEKFLKRNGADMVVYPERQMANWTAIRCSFENIIDYITVDEDYSIVEVNIPDDWHGKTLSQLNIRNKHGINVLGVRNDGRLDMDIGFDTLLTKEKTIMVLGSRKNIAKCFRV